MTVLLTMSRYGADQTTRHPPLRDALESAKGDVEDNAAAPVRIRMPGTVFGAGGVEFDTHQIYAMLPLVSLEDGPWD